MPGRSLTARLRGVPIEDFVGCAISWLLIGGIAAALRLFPAARVMPLIGESTADPPPLGGTARQIADAWFVHRAVQRASVRAPFRSDCLPQALVAAIWCRWLRIPAVALLGVRLGATPEEETMAAHAWVMFADVPISGGRGSGQFGPIARFRCYTPK